MDQNEVMELVKETQELFDDYKDNSGRSTWEGHVQEDSEFRYGKQWTDEQETELQRRGQSAIVVNRIHPAVETAKAMLTSRKPGFKSSAREDSDNKVAKVMDSLFEYIWDISDGNTQFRQIVDDYYVKSLGWSLVFQDSLADNGKGEVKWISLDPLDVYVDPSSRNRFFDDAENIIYSRLYTRDQARKYKPLYEDVLKNATGESWTERPVTNRVDSGDVQFPESLDIMDQTGDEYIRGYERYQMVFKSLYRVFDQSSAKEELLTQEEFIEFLKIPAWIVAGQIYRDQKMVMQVVQMFMQKTGQPPQVQEVSNQFLVQQGIIKVVNIKSKNVRVISVMGDSLLYVRDLPKNLHTYPIIPFPNLYTGTPFPTSDVRMAKGLQQYINKLRSLIIAHAATSTNVKVLLPKGSVDIEEFERNWARPGVGIEVDYDLGEPKPVAPTPLPNELYHNEQTAKNDINHQFGIYEMMMGDTANAPDTYKATISLDEYGQRKIRSKLADLEASLKRMAEVMIPFIQQLYTQEKIIRLVQPNNNVNEYTVNKRLVDDKTNEIKVMNDITVGNYDVKVVTGSTLPSNRYAELELHMAAYEKGLIDRQEVLKKTDIYDIEGVLQRTDYIAQLEQQLQGAGEKIKQLEGDLQTREREAYHAKQDAKLAQFSAKLDGLKSKSSAAGVLYEQRLKDELAKTKKDSQEKANKDKPSK